MNDLETKGIKPQGFCEQLGGSLHCATVTGIHGDIPGYVKDGIGYYSWGGRAWKSEVFKIFKGQKLVKDFHSYPSPGF